MTAKTTRILKLVCIALIIGIVLRMSNNETIGIAAGASGVWVGFRLIFLAWQDIAERFKL